MADANLRVVVSAEDRASKTLEGFSAKTVAIGSAIGSFLGNVATRAVSGLVDELGEAAKRVDTLRNANRTFENMGFQTAQVRVAMESLNKSILGLPTPLDEAVRGVTMLAAANNDIGKAQKVYSALNDAILGFGGNTVDVQGAVLQLSQDMAGGVLHAQTWNSLLQNGLGPTLAAIARQMGFTTQQLRDGLSNGSISVGQFQDALINLDVNGGGGLKSLHQIAMDSTNGIQTSFENAKTAIIRALATLIDTIGQQNIANAIQGIGNAIAGLIIFLGNIKTALDILKPAWDILVQTFNAQLRPALENLWVALQPILPYLGIALIGAIYLFVGALTVAINIISTIINWIAQFILWIERITGATRDSAGQVSSAVRVIGDAFRALPGIAAAVADGVRSGILRMLGPIGQAIDYVSRLVSWFDRLRGGSGSATSVLHGLHVPGFASGVENFAGGLAVVGERGPELVNLPRGSSVTPNNQISSVSPTVNVTFQGVFTGNEADFRKLAVKVFQAANDAASAKNMTLTEMF